MNLNNESLTVLMYLNLDSPPPLPAPPQKAAKKRILLQVLVPKLQALVKNANKYHNIHLKTVKWPKLSLIMALYHKTESCNLYNVGCYDLQQNEDNDEKKKFSVSQAPFLQFLGLHGFFHHSCLFLEIV